MQMAQLYENITNSIVADLEKGVAPWLKPWKSGNSTGLLPANAATKRGYNGINIPILWYAAEKQGYPTHRWMTFKQALELGANVRKGEKSTHVVFTKKLTIKEDDEDKLIPMLRAYSVFNTAQIDGLEPERPQELPEDKRDDRVSAFIAATKAEIRLGGDLACYIPKLDCIALPHPCAFHTYENYQATALHELGHWSGHKDRLNRDLAHRFRTEAYAAEELVAELNAAFLCAHLGIKGELKHAEYIASWIQLLKNDNRAVFTAASKASQAANYLRSFSETVEVEHVD
jgi:antirestriction protein ArdC